MATAPAPAAVERAGGVFWSTVSGGAAVVVPFVIFAAFSRLMSPAQLANVAVATAMLEMLKAVGPQGFYDVLVRQREDDIAHHRAGMFLFLAFAVVYGTIFCILVLFAAHVVGQALPPIVMILGLKLVFDYAALQPQAILARRGAMRRLGSRGLMSGMIAGVGGLALAFVTGPVVGLSVYYVLQALINFVLLSVGTNALVRPGFDGARIREMATQGWRASGVRATNAFQNYFDQVLLSHMLLPTALGGYNLGKRLEVVCMTLAGSFSQLMFQPGFARAQTSEERTKWMARGVAAISLVCGVPVVVLLVCNKLAIPFVFGNQWAGAALVAALLALAGLIRSYGVVAGALYTVTGRNGRLLAISGFAAVTSLVLVFLFARYGVLAAAMIVPARALGITAMQFVFSGLSLRHIARFLVLNSALPLVAIGIAASVSQWLLISWLGTQSLVSVFVILAGTGCIGGLVGFAMLRRKY